MPLHKKTPSRSQIAAERKHPVFVPALNSSDPDGDLAFPSAMTGRSSGLPGPNSPSHPDFGGAVTFHPVRIDRDFAGGNYTLISNDVGITALAIVRRNLTGFPFHLPRRLASRRTPIMLFEENSPNDRFCQ